MEHLAEPGHTTILWPRQSWLLWSEIGTSNLARLDIISAQKESQPPFFQRKDAKRGDKLIVMTVMAVMIKN